LSSSRLLLSFSILQPLGLVAVFADGLEHLEVSDGHAGVVDHTGVIDVYGLLMMNLGTASGSFSASAHRPSSINSPAINAVRGSKLR